MTAVFPLPMKTQIILAHFDNPLHVRLAVVICGDILFIIFLFILNNLVVRTFPIRKLWLRLRKRSSAQLIPHRHWLAYEFGWPFLGRPVPYAIICCPPRKERPRDIISVCFSIHRCVAYLWQSLYKHLQFFDNVYKHLHFFNYVLPWYVVTL